MAVVVGFIKDSAGNLINGKLRISLQSFEKDGDTGLKVTVPFDLEIEDGQVLVELAPLEQPYRWQFFQVVPAVVEDGEIVEPAKDVEIFDFLAKVPNDSTVLFNELVPTQIVRDNMDTSALRVAQVIANDPVLRDLVAFTLTPRGVWSAEAAYTRDDVVTYDGGSYLFFQPGFHVGKNPTDINYWFKLSERGATGTGTTGNDTAYDPIGWDGQTDAPSRNAVRDEIESIYSVIDGLDFVTSNSPIFTGDVIVPTLTSGDVSTKAVNSEFYWDGLQHILSPSNPDKPFAPTPVADDNTGALVNTEWFWNRLDSLTRPSDSGNIVFRGAGAELGYTLPLSDDSDKVVSASWVQSVLSNVFAVPGDFFPYLNNASSSTPSYSIADDSVVNADWVRNRTGAINIVSQSANHIRFALNNLTPDGFLTVRWGALSVPTFSTSLVSGIHRATLNVTFPVNTPLFPTSFVTPIVALATVRSNGDAVLNLAATPVANTREVTLVITSSTALSMVSNLFVNVFCIGYV